MAASEELRDGVYVAWGHYDVTSVWSIYTVSVLSHGVYVCMYVYIYIYMCVCVCVCHHVRLGGGGGGGCVTVCAWVTVCSSTNVSVYGSVYSGMVLTVCACVCSRVYVCVAVWVCVVVCKGACVSVCVCVVVSVSACGGIYRYCSHSTRWGSGRWVTIVPYLYTYLFAYCGLMKIPGCNKLYK